MQYCCPVPGAENQTSFTDALKAKPARDSQPLDSARGLPPPSMTMTSPLSSKLGGCLKYATLLPSGDTRTSLIQFSPCHKVLPIGYCSCQLPLTPPPG